jgi:hydrogenase expression/formation protein HypC
MCLGIPGKVVERYERDGARFGKVDFDGILKEVCMEYLPDLPIGAYTIVHVGFAIAELDEQEALESLALMRSLGVLTEELDPAEAERIAAFQAGLRRAMTGLRLAVVGKGGAGKSFISATLARSLARSGRTVALLDSDALPGAAISLGMGPMSDPMLADAAQETIEGWRLKRGIGPATAIRRYSRTGPDGVRLLQYGKAGDQGLAGMWGSVHAFNMVSKRLARERVLQDWDLIADLAAGISPDRPEQGALRQPVLVVVGPGAPSMLTARRLVSMAGAGVPTSASSATGSKPGTSRRSSAWVPRWWR